MKLSGVARSLAATSIALLIAPAAQSAELRWEKDYKTARTLARAEGRIVMVDFWAAWCTFCKKLDQTTYQDPGVVRRLSRTTVSVKVNTEGRDDEQELAAEHGVEDLPTIGFFTPEGRAVARIEGYVNAQNFLKLLTTAETQGADMLAWEKTLRSDPGNFAALYGLGSKMYELNYHDDARPLLERARKNDQGPLRERKRVRLMLARIIETRLSLADSEALLREGLSLEKEPDLDPRLQILLARCLAGVGKRAEAKAELAKLIAAYPAHPVTKTAKKSLEDLR
jgi:thioredoxin-like negative regulator of GroEL